MMTIYYLNENNRTGFNGVCPLVITLGDFDGVHIGHLRLINEAVRLSGESDAVSAVWSLKYNREQYKMPYLTDIDEKLELFRKNKIGIAVFEDFNEISNLSPREFVRDILIGKLNCRTAVCGFNFHFGKNGKGDADKLKSLMNEYDRDCVIIPPVMFDGELISSTLIRTSIIRGDMELTNRLMGRPFSINLTVISGNKIGRTLGMPTINQIFPDMHIIPANGVYCTRCYVGGIRYNCVTNVGTRPTITGSDENIVCETHIIGYDGDLYGRKIKVEFYKLLRRERKFDSLENLKTAIKNDIKNAEEYLNNV